MPPFSKEKFEQTKGSEEESAQQEEPGGSEKEAETPEGEPEEKEDSGRMREETSKHWGKAEVAETSELKEEIEAEIEKQKTLKAKLENLPENPEEQLEVLKKLHEEIDTLEEEIVSIESRLNNLGYINAQSFEEEISQLRDELREARIEMRDELKEFGNKANKLEQSEGIIESCEEKVSDFEDWKERETKEMIEKLEELKEENQGILGGLIGGDQQEVDKIEKAISSLESEKLEQALEDIKSLSSRIYSGDLENLISNQSRVQERKQTKKEHVSKRNELKEKLAELREGSESNLEDVFEKYRKILSKSEKLERELREAQAFLEEKVFSDLAISEKDEEEYVKRAPATEIERELGKYKARQSFQNTREVFRTYFQDYCENSEEDLFEAYGEFQEILENAEDTTRCEMNTDKQTLELILEEELIKSLQAMPKENRLDNAKPGLLGNERTYLHDRERVEQALDTYGRFPVYTALSTENPYDSQKGPAPIHGPVVLKLDDDVFERSRFIFGDSMETSQYSLIESFNPRYRGAESHKTENRALIKDHAIIAKAMLDHYFAEGDPDFQNYSRYAEKDGEDASLHYIETQVTNDRYEKGISLEEIEKIKFTRGAEPSDELEKKLQEKGIDYELVE